jgi:hypothetical protein
VLDGLRLLFEGEATSGSPKAFSRPEPFGYQDAATDPDCFGLLIADAPIDEGVQSVLP